MEITLNAIVGASSIIGVAVIFVRQITNRAKLEALVNDMKADMAKLETTQDQTAKALTEFELRSHQEFASTAMLERMENRMIQAMDRLGDRIDKSITAKVG